MILERRCSKNGKIRKRTRRERSSNEEINLEKGNIVDILKKKKKWELEGGRGVVP